MDNRTCCNLKKIVAIFISICFVFAAFPTSVSAATVKKPAQVKITSVKATQANAKNNSTVTVKWKKVKKNVTAYQVYQKINKDKWKLAKTVKKNKTSIKLTVKGGKKYQYKVRGINKKKIKKKYKTAKGKFSKTKVVSIKAYKNPTPAIPDEGSYECNFIDIETIAGTKTLSCVFEYTNMDKYQKNPANYIIVKAVQDGKALTQTSGTISVNVTGLTKVKSPLAFRYNSENPILLQAITKSDNSIVLEYVIPVSNGDGSDVIDDNDTDTPIEGTEDNPIDPANTFIVEDYDCTIEARLTNAYVGENALAFLSEMGENPSRFTYNNSPDYKTVVLEYSVLVKSGTFGGDQLGGGMYEPNMTSKMDFLCYELLENADKALFGGNLQMVSGESGTVYCVYGIPIEFNDFYEKLYSKGSYLWFHYTLN